MIPDILKDRLYNQQLQGPRFGAPSQLVEWMGAIQAQDYGMCKWAVGTRLHGTTEALIEAEIDKGEIIRTHVLRPTWHLVHAKDLRWMLDLTASQINQKAGTMYRQLELDEPIFKKSNKVLLSILKNGNQLTRQEIMVELEKKRIVTNDLRGAHLMFRAELDMVVCNGARRGNQFTYALFDERIPAAKSIKREEALAKLALRYFNSHGPATLADFTWWSGLTLTAAKTAIESIKNKLNCETINDQMFWWGNEQPVKKTVPGQLHLLPAYDEWMIGYADRSATLATKFSRKTILNNGIFKPVILQEGKVVGLWKKNKTNTGIEIEIEMLAAQRSIKKGMLTDKANEIANFYGRPMQLRIL